MGLIATIQKIAKCRRGNAIAIVAATTPLLVGASAVGVDTIQVTLAKRALQRSADSAAMAGAFAVMRRTSSQTEQGAAEGAVDRDLLLNNRITLASARVVDQQPEVGPEAGNPQAVRVVLTASRSVPFTSFFTGQSMTVSVTATAAIVPDGIYCVHAKERGDVPGITFAGSAVTNLGCGVFANSRSAQAVLVNGNPNVTVNPVGAVGGVPPASTFIGNPQVLPYMHPQPDPFEGLQVPEFNDEDDCLPLLDVGNGSSVTIGDGRGGDTAGDNTVCYRGMDIKGTLTIDANTTVIINGNTLKFGSQADVNGTAGVTFILTSSDPAPAPTAPAIAMLDMAGGAKVQLTSQNTGPYSGLILFQDPRATGRSPHINGNSSSVLDGAMYFPSTELVFNGNTGMTVKCLRMVGLRVTFSGNSEVVNTCPASALNRGFEGLTVRLVG